MFRYLKGSLALALTYKGTPSLGALPTLMGFGDASHGGDLDDRKSIRGHAFTVAGGEICWKSKKKPTVAGSSTEAEYLEASEAAAEALGLRHIFKELGWPLTEAIEIFTDSLGAIVLACLAALLASYSCSDTISVINRGGSSWKTGKTFSLEPSIPRVHWTRS